MQQVSQNVKGSGENVSVVVVLTNMNTGVRAQIGTYFFNFATGAVTVQTEDIVAAFNSVGGFDNSTQATEPETEAPTEAPTEWVEPVTDATQTEPPTDAPQTTTTVATTTYDPSLYGVFYRDAGDGYGYFDVYGNYFSYQ